MCHLRCEGDGTRKKRNKTPTLLFKHGVKIKRKNGTKRDVWIKSIRQPSAHVSDATELLMVEWIYRQSLHLILVSNSTHFKLLTTNYDVIPSSARLHSF